MIPKKDTIPSKKKGSYHTHNWQEYNKALVQRGSITFWFSEDAINKWYSTGAQPVIPPPRNAVVRKAIDWATIRRNNAIKEIRGFGGNDEARAIWKKIMGYHIRSALLHKSI